MSIIHHQHIQHTHTVLPLHPIRIPMHPQFRPVLVPLLLDLIHLTIITTTAITTITTTTITFTAKFGIQLRARLLY